MVQPESSPPLDDDPGTFVGPGSKSPVLPLAPELLLVPPLLVLSIGAQSRIVISWTLPASGRQRAFVAAQAPGAFADVVHVSPEFFPAQTVGALAHAGMLVQTSVCVAAAGSPHCDARHAQVADPHSAQGDPASPPSAHAMTVPASHATGAGPTSA